MTINVDAGAFKPAKRSIRPLGIYIHIPFCLRKCLYCDFCSYTGHGSAAISLYAEEAVKQLKEWRERCAGYTVDTVYFGGGTPTLLGLSDFSLILDTICANFHISPYSEISTECNPATADKAYLTSLHKLGINRISIGTQSFDDAELGRLGRIHTAAEARRTYYNARTAGFDNINLDIMYGIPGQTPQSLITTLDVVRLLDPEHVSAYCLKVEPGTPFGEMGESLVLPDDDSELQMYTGICERLSLCGISRYEISNFAKPGYECRHNLKYWNCDEYIGTGVSAHSYFAGRRFACRRELDKYLSGEYACADESSGELTASECETEYVMLRMRLERGLLREDYFKRFGVDPAMKYKERFAPFVMSGHVESDGDGYRFTTAGMFVSNYILSSVLDL